MHVINTHAHRDNCGLGHETGPGRCRFLLPELSRFNLIGHIIFRAVVALKTSVPYACRFVACSSRIKVSQPDTDEYRNPRCACAPRVNKQETPETERTIAGT